MTWRLCRKKGHNVVDKLPGSPARIPCWPYWWQMGQDQQDRRHCWLHWRNRNILSLWLLLSLEVVYTKIFWRNVSDWLILLSEIKALMLSIDKMNSVGVVPAAWCIVASFAAEVAVDVIVVEVVLRLSCLDFAFVVIVIALAAVVVALLRLAVVAVLLVVMLVVVFAFFPLPLLLFQE